MFKRLKRQDGDTIVEVLISLAILTLILGGAYYTASLSFSNDRDSLEHTEALTIAESQIEDLRTMGPNVDSQSLSTLTNNCVANSGGTLSLSSSCFVYSNNTAILKSACPTPPNPPYCYQINVTRTVYPDFHLANLDTYDVDVTWQPGGISNSKLDSVSLYYRVDQVI